MQDVRAVVLDQQLKSAAIAPQMPAPKVDGVVAGEVADGGIADEAERGFDELQAARQSQLPRRGAKVDVNRRDGRIRERTAEEP